MTLNTAAQSKPRRSGEFTFVTKAIQTYQEDDRRRWKAIASSSIQDRVGDEISIKALEQMAGTLKGGINIFMNHSHLVPEDVFGVSDNAMVRSSGLNDKDGNAIYDLHAEGWVNEVNPRAVQLADAIDRGVRFGTSIGALVKNHTRKKEGGLKVDGIELLEASIVGIPMNQRTWVQKAAGSLADTDETVYEAGDDADETIGDAIAKAVAPAVIATLVEDMHKAASEEKTEADAEEAIETDESTEKADKCPTCGGGRGEDGDCTDEYHSVAKSVDSASIDVTSGVQEALEATPETAPAADEDSATDTEETQKALTVSADDMSALVKSIENLVTRLAAAEKERDEALEATTKAQAEIDTAKEVIEKVTKMPLTRKATGAIEDFSTRYPQFDSRIEKYLNRS